MNDEDLKKLITYKIERSLASLDDAKFLIENKKYLLAANRLYYSAFYIINAMALKYNFQTSKHTQLIGWFNKNFISTGKIEKDYGKTLVKLFDNRVKADYDDFIEIPIEQINKLYNDANNLINRIIKYINEY